MSTGGELSNPTNSVEVAGAEASDKGSDNKKKRSSIRHTRAIQKDRVQRHPSAPPDEEIVALLEELVSPAAYALTSFLRQRGMRERCLTLPVMLAVVLAMCWQEIGSVREAVRCLNQEGLLWVEPTAVTPQAVSARLKKLPGEMFHAVLMQVLPRMQERWAKRERPLPRVMEFARQQFTSIVAVDGSTLDALLRKTKLLQEKDKGVLAGKTCVLLDLLTRLPRQVWYEEAPRTNDQRFWDQIVAALEPGSLVLFDMGFVCYARFDELTERGISFLTRVPVDTAIETVRELGNGPHFRDRLVRVGAKGHRCQSVLRLVEWHFQGIQYRYLTNVLDTQKLPAACVVALYGQRWRIEEAFYVVKRLLGLAYFWCGTPNAVLAQVWATWLLYCMLIDLTDDVAGLLHLPFQALSAEMVYRGLYHYAHARKRGVQLSPQDYLAKHARNLNIVKQKRKHRSPAQALLDQLVALAAEHP